MQKVVRSRREPRIVRCCLKAERRYGGIQPVCSTFFLHSEGVHAITFLKALLKLTVLL